MNPVVLIFARYPEPGSVKTRLCPGLSPAQAAHLQRAMTEDVVALHEAGAAHDTIVCFSPAELRDNFSSWLGEGVSLMPQEGDDLGERQLGAMRAAFDLGYDGAVIIGTDCPFVTRPDIESAFESLKAADLVLGPSEDGGYYLIGARKAYPPLFEGIEWGGPRVLEDTLKKAEAAHVSTRLLEPHLDVDRYDDLRTVYSLLKAEAAAGWPGPVVARATFDDLDCILGADTA
jgi:rSAM/selenodomain-associated transferase 1